MHVLAKVTAVTCSISVAKAVAVKLVRHSAARWPEKLDAFGTYVERIAFVLLEMIGG